jgi:tRNA (Thr-GGU) A37 N-methylase
MVVTSVKGIDMLDATPVLNLKPYMSGIPSEKLRLGWFAEAQARRAAEEKRKS